jgi:hypothetical protein
VVLLIGSNPRTESPVLNARLRKIHLDGTQIGLVGEVRSSQQPPHKAPPPHTDLVIRVPHPVSPSSPPGGGRPTQAADGTQRSLPPGLRA